MIVINFIKGWWLTIITGIFVVFVVLLRALRIISRRRFEKLLFGIPEKMSDRPYPFD